MKAPHLFEYKSQISSRTSFRFRNVFLIIGKFEACETAQKAHSVIIFVNDDVSFLLLSIIPQTAGKLTKSPAVCSRFYIEISFPDNFI